jgi:hypothetical protein
MRYFVAVLLAFLVASSFTAGGTESDWPPARTPRGTAVWCNLTEADPGPITGTVPAKSVRELYATFKGPWSPDDDNSPLKGFWLHRYEKADKALPGASWAVILRFTGQSPEGYEGPPEKVEGEADGMRITLPRAAEEEKRGTRALCIRRAGDRLHVEVIGGQFAGAYKLKRTPSKY